LVRTRLGPARVDSNSLEELGHIASLDVPAGSAERLFQRTPLRPSRRVGGTERDGFATKTTGKMRTKPESPSPRADTEHVDLQPLAATGSGSAPFAMQNVEGSSPFIRS
jgi:hypothetical protein